MTPKRLFPPLNCLCPLFGHGDKRVASTGAVSNQLDHTREQLAPIAWPRRGTELLSSRHLIALFILHGRPSPAISTSCSCFQFLSPWYEHIWRYERQPHGKLLSTVFWQKLHDHLTVWERMLHLALIPFTQDNPDYEHAGVGWASVQIFLFLKTFGACYSGGTRSQHSSLWNFNTSGYNHHLICGKTNVGSSPNSSCFVLSTCRGAYPSHTGQSSNDHDDLFLTSQHPPGTDDLGGFCLAWNSVKRGSESWQFYHLRMGHSRSSHRLCCVIVVPLGGCFYLELSPENECHVLPIYINKTKEHNNQFMKLELDEKVKCLV